MNKIRPENPSKLGMLSTVVKKLALVVILCLPLALSALDLSSAKSRGLIGETDSGYVALVGRSNPSLNQLVKNINDKRKVRYQMIAKKNNVALNIVALQAGKKLVGKAAKGEQIRISGRWQKK